jgi:Na+-translocating ferredoxin:NAD+ oxidoreductase RnfG subunit
VNLRVPTLTAVLSLALLGGGPAGACADAPARLTPDQALALAFPGARVVRARYALTDAQARQVENAARAKLGARTGALYRAWRGDTLVGTAWFESRVVRTMPAVLMVVVAPDTTVARVEVLAFHEPPDYRPVPRWQQQFAARPLDDRLWPGRGVRPLAGATLTTRTVTEVVRLALALVATLPVTP